ncbi:MAG: hypothetical protein C5B51_06955 [Terriglobia bacterium]|nr:MAG: hypothetical protein C5B51_06955 [Terriglobia bacterium]
MISVACLFAAGARADLVYISDLTDTQPVVQVFSGGVDVTGSRVTILSDSTDEYLHFKLLINNFGDGSLAYSNLFEDFLGGLLSDRIVVFFDPNAQANGGIDVKFCSDAAFSLCDITNATFHYPLDAVEDGSFQLMAQAFNTQIGDDTYDMYVSSDVADVPEPGMGLLAAGLAGVMVWWRKRARRTA